MPTRKLLILSFACLLFASATFADCTWLSTWAGQYRTTALDVSLDGNDLWVATSWGVALFDRSVDPPRPVTSIAIPQTTTRVRASNGYLYASSGSSFYVLRPRPLQIIRSVDVGALITDMVIDGSWAYVSAAGGVTQIDLLLPENPQISKRLPITGTTASSLAILNGTLYASDGDPSVEAYGIQVPTLPQKIGTFNSLPRPTSVRAIGGNLLVSDGNQTEVFAGTGAAMTRISILPAAGATAAFAIGPNSAYIAGADRRLRAVDFAIAYSPVTLFEQEIALSGGSVNRIGAITGSGGRVYVAAGDAGLLTFDTSGFTSPYPLHSYRFGGMSSVYVTGSTVFSAPVAGGLRKYAAGSDGTLSFQNEWDTSNVSTILDGGNGRLLVASSNQLNFWDVSGGTVVLSSASLQTTIRSGVLWGTTAVVVLDDRTAWSVDLSTTAGVPTKLSVSPAPWAVGRSASGIALVDINEGGNSTVRYFANGNLSAPPAAVDVDGAATSGVTLSDGGVAAVATFAGISAIDFTGGGGKRVFANSNSFIPRDLSASGGSLFLAGGSTLQQWSLSAGTLTRSYAVGGTPNSVSATPSIAVVATDSGLASVVAATTVTLPSQILSANSNSYYKRVVASDKRLYLFDGRNVDFFYVDTYGLPHFIRRLTPGSTIIDIAAASGQLLTLDASGMVTSYDAAGRLVGLYQISEGADAVPANLRAAGPAVWATVSFGCTSGVCQKKTIILDPRSGLGSTSSFAGGTVDVAADGDRAYVVSDLPSELRVYSITDPFHPALVKSIPAEGNPVAIAHANGSVFAVGSKVYVYTDSTLVKSGELLNAYTPDPTGRVGYPDQDLVFSGACAVLTGRTFDAQSYSVPTPLSWTASTHPPASAAYKSIAVQNSVLYLLSDYSLEVWRQTVPDMRRHPLRR